MQNYVVCSQFSKNAKKKGGGGGQARHQRVHSGLFWVVNLGFSGNSYLKKV